MFLTASRALILAVTAFAITGTASAQTTPPPHVPLQKATGTAKPEVVPSLFVLNSRVVTPADVRQAAPLAGHCRSGFVCRQDLFDRNNRNNLRSDWPGPPAQPGQF